MKKYYKSIQTGAVITEKEYNNLIRTEVTRDSMDFGGMNAVGMTEFMQNEMTNQEVDYGNYVPCDKEGNLL